MPSGLAPIASARRVGGFLTDVLAPPTRTPSLHHRRTGRRVGSWYDAVVYSYGGARDVRLGVRVRDVVVLGRRGHQQAAFKTPRWSNPSTWAVSTRWSMTAGCRARKRSSGKCTIPRSAENYAPSDGWSSAHWFRAKSG